MYQSLVVLVVLMIILVIELAISVWLVVVNYKTDELRTNYDSMYTALEGLYEARAKDTRTLQELIDHKARSIADRQGEQK